MDDGPVATRSTFVSVVGWIGLLGRGDIQNFTLLLSGNALMAASTQQIIFTGASPTAPCTVPTSGTLVCQ